MRFLALGLVVLAAMAACDGAPGASDAASPPPMRSSELPGQATDGPSPGSPEEVPDDGAGEVNPDPKSGRTYVVWTPGGFPNGAGTRLLEIPGVLHATEVTGGLIWVSESTSGDQPAEGYKTPLEIAFVDASALGRMFPGAPGFHFKDKKLFFSRTGAALRGGVGRGFRLSSDLGSLTGRCCVDDRSAMGYEALAIGAPPPGWGTSFALVRSEREPTLRDVRRAVGDGPWRVRSHSDTNFLRYADAVLPQMFLKEHFGEFSALPSSDGSIDIHPGWVRRNIVQARVPILGEVECHRVLFEQMRSALAGVEEDGLAGLIKPDEYAGCFNARFIGRDPDGRISSHTWGAAFDIAAASNPLGAPPTLDLKVVRLFEQAGFTWGGRWLVPDGMHFEYSRPSNS